jgi:hypothetical protein
MLAQAKSHPLKSNFRMLTHKRLPLIHQSQPYLLRLLHTHRPSLNLLKNLFPQLLTQLVQRLPTPIHLLNNLLKPPFLLLRRHTSRPDDPDLRIYQEQR